jgi:hypothetical protein
MLRADRVRVRMPQMRRDRLDKATGFEERDLHFLGRELSVTSAVLVAISISIPNSITCVFTIPNALVVPPITITSLPRVEIVRRYPTDCLHTNRQLEALGVMLSRRRVSFWDEVLS